MSTLLDLSFPSSIRRGRFAPAWGPHRRVTRPTNDADGRHDLRRRSRTPGGGGDGRKHFRFIVLSSTLVEIVNIDQDY
ncbi:hypothetical protein CDAR_585461 [Caerostris darwini]|uniref:Uncharacterized protein n=1 Tax=Caerostris darwini TaxID=1538125 RepID=A0AAV4X055_9ARAC|nr:hypothetical protein CDAR_585461 [Caerostris darwini]